MTNSFQQVPQVGYIFKADSGNVYLVKTKGEYIYDCQLLSPTDPIAFYNNIDYTLPDNVAKALYTFLNKDSETNIINKVIGLVRNKLVGELKEIEAQFLLIPQSFTTLKLQQNLLYNVVENGLKYPNLDTLRKALVRAFQQIRTKLSLLLREALQQNKTSLLSFKGIEEYLQQKSPQSIRASLQGSYIQMDYTRISKITGGFKVNDYSNYYKDFKSSKDIKALLDNIIATNKD